MVTSAHSQFAQPPERWNSESEGMVGKYYFPSETSVCQRYTMAQLNNANKSRVLQELELTGAPFNCMVLWYYILTCSNSCSKTSFTRAVVKYSSYIIKSP